MIDIRQPNITAKTETEQLLQIRSYLYQMAQQLQWAFNTISSPGGGGNVGTNTTQQTVVSSSSSGKIDATKTFDALKDLIIKSSDIVNAYYDVISKKLVGVYVAQSDFGRYQEETSNTIKESSTRIDQLYVNNQVITGKFNTIDRLVTTTQSLTETIGNLETDKSALSEKVDAISSAADGMADTIEQLQTMMVQTNAYVRTGLLYEDDNGIPVYGLEIGQTNDVNGENVFSKFARFSADRLSFYDRNDTEVAYISDYKLYITNAEITGALSLAGKFKVFYDHGLAFQWIGGNS